MPDTHHIAILDDVVLALEPESAAGEGYLKRRLNEDV